VAHASGETWPHVIKQTGVSTCRNTKGGWDDKSLNKCHTAARKYFLLALFQIPTGDEEDDADRGENKPATRHVPAVVRRVQSITPPTVAPAPKHALKQGGIAERAVSGRYAQAVRSAGPSQPFPASEAGKAFSPRFRAQAGHVDEPPPHDFVPDGPGEAARALNRRLHPMNDGLPDHSAPPKLDQTERDGVPAFLDRRRQANGNAGDTGEATFVDLVAGGR
jgi:hypothetical protein